MSLTFSTDDYLVPEWSSEPRYSYQYKLPIFSFEIIKEGSIMGNLDLRKKPFILIGRVNDLCDLFIDNASVSRKHAILQFKENDDFPYLYDLGGTHGTIVNKNKLPVRAYQKLKPFDMIKFGLSSRYYILRCPQLEHQEQEDENNEDNKFLEILNERNKELSKQELKDKYLDLLENDPYFKANNLSKKLQGSSTKREVNGVDWGISDELDVYAYKNDNDLQLEPDILRRLPGMDSIQLNRISEFETNLRKYEEIEGDLNELSNKEKREFGLEEKLRDRKEKLEKRFVEAVEVLEKSEDWIRVNIFGEVASKVAKKQKLEKEDDTFEDDEFFDRTITAKREKREQQEKKKDESEEKEMFTTQDFWKLEKELRSEFKTLISLEKDIDSGNGENEKKEEMEEADDLDAFMKENNENLEKEEAVLFRERMIEVQHKIKEISNYLVSLIGQEYVTKIEKEERGIIEKGGLSEEEKKARKEADNKRRIDDVLNKLDIIKEMEEEVDEEDIKIFDLYRAKKGEMDEDEEDSPSYRNSKRARPAELDAEEKKVEKAKMKMYPCLKEDRDRDKYESDEGDGNEEYFDITKLK